MKIDLHCHTKKVKSGDPESRNVSPALFAQKVRDAGVDILAVTNHNLFDFNQFNELNMAVSGECQLWPGVEFDVECRSGSAHILVVCDPDKVQSFDQAVKQFTNGTNPNDFKAPIKNVIDFFEPLEVIFIPHHRKDPGINDNDIEEIKQYLKDQSRLFLESTYRSVGILANFKEHVIAGSDVKDWNQYEKSSFPELRLPIGSFRQFCLLAKKDEQVIKTLIDTKKSHKVVATPCDNVNFELTLYSDINVFFGQKGTGKTKILESLATYFEAQGKTCSTYYSFKRESDFSAAKQITPDNFSCDALDVSDCHTEFSTILNWLESKPTEIQKYIDSIQSTKTKKSRQDFRLADAEQISIQKFDKKIRDDYTKSLDVLGIVKKILLKQYLAPDVAKRLEYDLTSLSETILKKYRSSWIEENSIKLANSMLENIRIHADQFTGTISLPSGTGLVEFYKNRLELNQALSPIYNCLFKVPENTSFDIMGEIEGKGSLYSRLRHRFICKQSEAKEFAGTYLIVKRLKSRIETIYKNPFKIDTASLTLQFKGECLQKEINSLSAFVGVSLDYVLDKKTPYMPSTGEKGMILLEKVLDENSDVYILDEPEMGMGSSFINSLIIPKLNELSKSFKIVIVSTHNANVAVRTLPYVSIYREHNNGEYFTFTGNPFSDKLKEISDRCPDKNWTDVSMHVLEGGREAFYERKRIYES